MHRVLSAEQLACLASPSANEVFSALRGMGRATAKEIGMRTGRTAATATYHLGRLEAAGLIKLSERRPAVRRPEAVFEPVGDSFHLPTDEATRGLRARAVAAGIRQGLRAWERAVETDLYPRSVIRAHARLSSTDLEEFLRILETAATFLREHDQDGGLHVQWNSLVSPDC